MPKAVYEKKVLRCIQIGDLYELTDTELVAVQNKILSILADRRNALKEIYYDKLQDILQEMYESGFIICDRNHYYGDFKNSREDFKIYFDEEQGE